MEINAYIQIADEMNQRIADARAKVAEYDASSSLLPTRLPRSSAPT